jgi:tetratricopeptide (TPR) repeat protein
VAVLLGVLWRAWVMGGVGVVSRAAEIPETQRSLVHAPPQGARSLVAMLGQLAWPRGLSPVYPEPASTPGAALAGWLCLALLVATAVLAFRARRRHPLLALGVLGGLLASLPTMGIVPLSNLRADRYAYAPSLAIFLVVATALVAGLQAARWMRGGPLFDLPRPWLAIAALLLLLGLLTMRQGRLWRSDLALWEEATRRDPASPDAWSALGEARLRAGLPEGALEAVRRALTLADEPHARELLGIVLMERGDLPAARRALAAALAAAPAHHRAELLNDLGACELRLGLVDLALHRFEEARTLAPGYDRPWLNAARVLESRGQDEQALALLRALLVAAPESFDGWAQLGAVLERQGRAAEAGQAFRRARALGYRGSPGKSGL